MWRSFRPIYLLTFADVPNENTLETPAIKAELEEAEGKVQATKRRVLGNVAFIGELFRKKMITSRIINTCIVDLVSDEALENPDAYFAQPANHSKITHEDVQCLAKLFKTVGRDLDVGEFRRVVDRYFMFLQGALMVSFFFLIFLLIFFVETDLFSFCAATVLGKQRFLDARHRFMVQDLCELRLNDWQERRESLKVKTKDEVKADFDNQEIEAQRRSMAGGNRGGRGGAMGSSSRGGMHG